MVLENINKTGDIKKVSSSQYDILAREIRQFLIEKVSKTGGHLASNLGVVELTMALHLVFNLPEDKIIWDVGHQSYVHKILTGRKEGFDELRQFGGMSGFPKRNESASDAFNTGHSSTSISAGLGLVQARDLLGQSHSVVSVIGDGSLTGGMAYEAMNNAARLKTNFIIVLNDNEMSISRNIGGVSKHLSDIRTASSYTNLKNQVTKQLEQVPGIGKKMIKRISKTKSSLKQLLVSEMLFENMGLTYLGPVSGHDIHELKHMFNLAKRVQGPVVVHVVTKKGKGYFPAEQNPSAYHGVSSFDIETGCPKKKKTMPSWTDVFSRKLCQLARTDDKIVAITAAMPQGTGLDSFQRKFPNRFFDVGIAEEHAVTFAAGLAAGGLKPVFAVYSSFLQRGYDQLVHDIGLQHLPVVFAIDRAGLVGSDGETHQGIFDLSFLSTIPEMIVCAPKNQYELEDMLEYAFKQDGPVAIRYPRGNTWQGLKEYRQPIETGKSEIIVHDRDILLLAVGSMVETAMKVRENLVKEGYHASVVNVRFVNPFNYECLRAMLCTHPLVVTMEENIYTGGYGEKVASFIGRVGVETIVLPFAIPDVYVEHGDVNTLKEFIGLDVNHLTQAILDVVPFIQFDQENIKIKTDA
ncbi:1-deoxy-D-xylulose 5-phosphate synthase [Lachnospiraceae bacterium TWA4]|nr:1-deoxy-D-xylulose 5-phosphate synthase [Lachnospiraceae bacterium TWA4]